MSISDLKNNPKNLIIAKSVKLSKMINKKEPKLEKLRTTSELLEWIKFSNKKHHLKFSLFRDLLSYDISLAIISNYASDIHPSIRDFMKVELFKRVRSSIPVISCERFICNAHKHGWKVIFDVEKSGVVLYTIENKVRKKIIDHYIWEIETNQTLYYKLEPPPFLK
ncbi:MAG: hypothetical protein N3G74_02325 [Candidatus Micrarchaeota archaeon]|nr:hypothetical protein [Candidatus Micrarchaeota archaeon]